MSRLVNAWNDTRIKYQKRYAYYAKEAANREENQDFLGHLHECSYVLIEVFGLSTAQVLELEKYDFCGLTNSDFEKYGSEVSYE